MTSFKKLSLVLGLSAFALGASTTAFALPIEVFNTGFNSSGTLLAGGSIDGNYTIVDDDDNLFPARVISATLPGSWLANTTASQWIWDGANGGPVNVTRTFRLSFDMSGLDLGSATLLGRWSVDNLGDDILVNGQSTGQLNLNGFGAWTGFSIDSSMLLSGLNTVDFVITDVGGIAGFRAEFTTATANAASASVPEASSTLILLGLAVVGLTAWNNRKSKL